MRRNNTKGFTLIELLVVTVMLSVVCLAIYSTFSSGARIWQRINGLSLNEDVNIFFDRFTGDVKNAVVFASLPFEGRADRFELATLVSSASLDARTVGRVVYSCTNDAVKRSLSDYSQLYQDIQSPPRTVLRDLKSCKFLYYRYDDEKKEYSWVDEWTGDGLPRAIRVVLLTGTDDAPRELVKTVSIPVAGRKEKK